MGIEFTPQQIVYGSWILFGIYWLVSAFRAKKTEKRELPAERLGHMIMMAAGYILLFQPNDHWGVLNQRFRCFLDRSAKRRDSSRRRFTRHLGALELRKKLERGSYHQARTSNHPRRPLRVHAPSDLYRYADRRNWIGTHSRRVSRCARVRHHSVRFLSKGAQRRNLPGGQFR
jgi:hypothetical protein